MELNSKSCFYCKFFKHLNPDDDFCEFHNCIVYLDCTCKDFYNYSDSILEKLECEYNV